MIASSPPSSLAAREVQVPFLPSHPIGTPTCYAPPAMGFWAETTFGALKGLLVFVFVFIPVGVIALLLVSGAAWAVLAAGTTALTWALGQIGVAEEDVPVVLGTLAVALLGYLVVAAISSDLKRW